MQSIPCSTLTLLFDLIICYMNKRKSSQTERQRVLILQENTSFCAVYEAGDKYAYLTKFIAFWSILESSWLVIHPLDCILQLLINHIRGTMC